MAYVSAVDANTDASMIVPLLLQLASVIPTAHYFLALLLLISVFLYNFLEFHLLDDLVSGYKGGRVRLTFSPASSIYRDVVSKCRTLRGRYLATPWLSNPHFQTAFLNFFGNPPAFRYKRQIFHAPDGGTIALDWMLASDVVGCSSNLNKAMTKEDTTPVVVVVPGLTSDSASSYVKHLVYRMAKQGWNVVVGNHRGLGGISITSDRLYNAGWTEDVRVIINHLHQEFPGAPLFAIGTSIGANILVKYLGEEGENTPVAGAVSVCSPWDLVVCDRFINRKLVQRFYDRVLAIGLKGYAQLHQPVLSRLADWEGIKRSRSVRDFDNYATRLVAKYETVDTYYRCCSSASYVGNVAIPLLCISALDDPVCTKEAIPWDECRGNKNIVLATTAHGGHLAFFQGLNANTLWWVEAVEEFLKVLHDSPHMHGQKVAVVGLRSSLDSEIDKAPYVNVMEDGRLAAVGNDGATINNPEDISSSQVFAEQHTDDREGEADHEIQLEIPSSTAADPMPPQHHELKAGSENCVDNLRELVAPVKKTLYQLSRQTSSSMWLLAYIAIMTTWPFLGSVLRIALKRRLSNVLPKVLGKR